MKHKRSTKGIWLDVGVLIVCLAIITSCLSSGMFAKFATRADRLKDSAQIASFNVSAVLRNASASIDGGAAEYELTLGNNSEAAVYYSVTLDFGPSAKGLAVRIGSKIASVDDNGTVTFERVGTMAPGRTNVTVGITVSRGEYAGGEETFDFTANVTFTQID
ncbi:MAG: hypothetical protein IKQ36_07580 [Clostridia bacterium]|nr:hypothetical protein [Clostridia bacterium]